MMKFRKIPLRFRTKRGIRKAGFVNLTSVQEAALPYSLDGNDVMVQAKTGSGKTAVFVLTFLEHYLCFGKNKPSCLIVAPTRELAKQIASDAAVLSSGIKNFRIGCFYGGVGYEEQRKALKNGCAMYVGTPGRLLEFLTSKELDGSKIDTFVIDEADRLFDMGFYMDLRKFFRFLPSKDKRQTMLFSATLETRVKHLAWQYMNADCKEICVKEGASVTVDTIKQELYHVAKKDKFHLLLQLLAKEKPASAIIFVNNRSTVYELQQKLRANSYKACTLSGDMTQNAREKALDAFKAGKFMFLIATDVASRGLQIDDLPFVINYDIPEDYENYVHRIGRTARAGKSGKAVTLADEEFVYGLEAIEKYINMKIPVMSAASLPDLKEKEMTHDMKIKYYMRKYGLKDKKVNNV